MGFDLCDVFVGIKLAGYKYYMVFPHRNMVLPAKTVKCCKV